MRNSQKELNRFQSLDSNTSAITITTYVKSFLLLTSLFSGCFVSIFLSNGKLVQELMKNSPDLGDAVTNPLFFLLSACTFAGMFINFYNLNVTMSMYS